MSLRNMISRIIVLDGLPRAVTSILLEDLVNNDPADTTNLGKSYIEVLSRRHVTTDNGSYGFLLVIRGGDMGELNERLGYIYKGLVRHLKNNLATAYECGAIIRINRGFDNLVTALCLQNDERLRNFTHSGGVIDISAWTITQYPPSLKDFKYKYVTPGPTTVLQIAVIDEERYTVCPENGFHPPLHICTKDYLTVLSETRGRNTTRSPAKAFLENKNKFLTAFLIQERDWYETDQNITPAPLVNNQTTTSQYVEPISGQEQSRTSMQFGASVPNTKRPRESVWGVQPTARANQPQVISSTTSSISGESRGFVMTTSEYIRNDQLNESFATDAPPTNRQRTESPESPEMIDNAEDDDLPTFDPVEVMTYLVHEADQHKMRELLCKDAETDDVDFESMLVIARAEYVKQKGDTAPW
jgi:hypothetical protein